MAVDTQPRVPSTRTVRAIVIASIVVTAFHYTDNYLFIEEYPAPDWIKPTTIYVAWSLLTLIGIAGYLFYRDAKPVAAALYLLVYSYTGLSSLAHYLYGPMDSFSLKMHLLVWADGSVGSIVAVCAVVIFLRRDHVASPRTASD